MDRYQSDKIPILEIKGISKAFDGKPILRDLNLKLFQGEIISLLGTSGSGKTTLFNIVAGILKPDQGVIFLKGEEITGETGHLAYMLQKDLLLPHLTILDNVGLPLRIRGKSKTESRAEALQLIPKFGLTGYEKLYPGQLSGGMAQRAAFLRTYLFHSEVALLDEPFSALDALTKDKVQAWYIEMMQELELSTIFITHDIDEAIRLSDRVVILQPQTQNIQQQIIIDLQLRKQKDFTLRTEFLEYKKQILKYLTV